MTPLESAKEKARLWKTYSLDAETRAEIERMEREDEKLFIDSFYSDLEFGTGGLRGVMGVGSMRMNKYTVGMATQGLANYILKHHAKAINLEKKKRAKIEIKKEKQTFKAQRINCRTEI